MNERPSGCHEVQILFIQLPRFASQQAYGHVNARGPQMRKAFARHFWIWIFNGRYDSTDAGIYQGVSAGRRAAVMCMRLKRDISGCATRALAGLFERVRFSVCQVFINVKAFANDCSRRRNNYATDQWTRADLPDALCSQRERAPHKAVIRFGPLANFIVDCRCCLLPRSPIQTD